MDVGRGVVYMTKIKCLRGRCNVRKMDRMRTVMIRGRCGKKLSFCEKADRGVLRWFKYLIKTSDERLESGVERKNE